MQRPWVCYLLKGNEWEGKERKRKDRKGKKRGKREKGKSTGFVAITVYGT